MQGLTPYELLGGEAMLKKLVTRFYEIMESEAFAQPIRRMHPENIKISEEKLFLFLSGWLGGPNLYFEKYGHPRLRARHLPFPIGVSERDQWLFCMEKALDELPIEPELREKLSEAFFNTADFMRNQNEA